MTDLLVWGGPVYAKTAQSVTWGAPTKVLTLARDGSQASAALYQQLSAKDGFAWAELARRAGIDPAQLGSLGLAGFSAFHGLANPMLASPIDRERVCYVHLADACFSGAGATAPKSGYLAFALDAVRGDALLVATTNGPFGEDIHYCYEETCYDLTSGAKCIAAVWDAALRETGADVRRPEVPPGVPTPTNAWQMGNFLWFHYESLPGDPHGAHANQLAAPYMQFFGAPWMADRTYPGMRTESSTAAKLAAAAAGFAAVLGGAWAYSRFRRRSYQANPSVRLYHGAHTKFAKHVGLCLTDDLESAMAYAAQGSHGTVATVTLELEGIEVLEVKGYDRDANEAPGDRGELSGADVVVYSDEDPRGMPHKTWRLMSQLALAQAKVVGRRRL